LSDTNSLPEPDKLIAFSNKLSDTLQDEYFKTYVKEILYKISDDFLEDVFSLTYENLPVFLEERDYVIIDSLINERN